MIKNCSSKKLVVFSILCFLLLNILSAENWVLGATKFTYAQGTNHSSVDESNTVLLPKLILQQISVDLVRNTSKDEVIIREIETLETERLSLFLQLSAETKTRDGYVLGSYRKSELKSKISESEKKIQNINKQIDENLSKTKDLYETLNQKTVNSKKKDILNPLKSIFDSSNQIKYKNISENVTFYNNSELISMDDSILYLGPDSREFEKKILDGKINGVIYGTITNLGKYIGVTVSLYTYPGKKCNFTVTEVGSIDDVVQISQLIAQKLSAAVTNQFPIDVYIQLSDESLRDKTSVTVDGEFYDSIPQKLILPSGRHKIVVEREGYLTRSFSYNFVDENTFVVTVPMIKEEFTTMEINLLNVYPGEFYLNGQFVAENDGLDGTSKAVIRVNGNPCIGEYLNQTGRFFFYVSPESQKNSVVALNSVPLNNEKEIEKRRIWTYRAYTCIVLSLPATLYTSGKVNVYPEEEKYLLAKYCSLGVTAAATTFFVVELAKYLKTTDCVLPENVHKTNDKQLEKAQKKALKRIEKQNVNNDNKSTEETEIPSETLESTNENN